MNETEGAVIIAIGVVFDLFGCIGLVRLPDIYNRVQAATKCVTFGTCLVLLGVVVVSGGQGIALGVKAIVCAVFVLLTSPTAAHALARAAHLSGVKLWENSVVDRFAEDREKKGTPR